MPPLKFRVWHKEKQEMELSALFCIPNNGAAVAEWDRIIPMQSTGLHDKNGVEIYEGDIVTAKSQGYAGTFEIRWREDGGASPLFILYPAWQNREMWYLAASRESDGLCYDRGIEVIGNRYQHSELLPTES